MNTHAAKTPQNSSQPAAAETLAQRVVEHPPAQFVDNHAAAMAHRNLQEMANASPRVRSVRALQLMADRWSQAGQADRSPEVRIQLAPAPVSRPGRAAPVQLIEAKRKDFIGRQVIHSKHGTGTIIKSQGPKYQVDFGSAKQPDKRFVPADELGFPEIESKGDAKEEKDVVDPITNDADTDVSDGLDAEVNVTSSGSTVSQAEVRVGGPVPAYLRLNRLKTSGQLKKAKFIDKCTLTLLDVSNQVILTMESVNLPQVKEYIEGNSRITSAKLATNIVKDGTYELVKDLKLFGSMKDHFDIVMNEWWANEDLRAYHKELAGSINEPGELLSQKEVYDRLIKLDEKKKATLKSGNSQNSMTKIPLPNPTTLFVGGVHREITHLYTQKGNDNELRCYLGTKDGAYQRVHTSMTMDAERSSHTMVQTGEKVATPGGGRVGERIGFNAKENPQRKGFAARELTYRTTKQCTVDDWLKGVEWNSLKSDQKLGCRLLANTFNAALDRVCADLNKGEASKMGVTLNDQDFETLDDRWLFEGGAFATPAEEWRRGQQTQVGRDGAADKEKSLEPEIKGQGAHEDLHGSLIEMHQIQLNLEQAHHNIAFYKCKVAQGVDFDLLSSVANQLSLTKYVPETHLLVVSGVDWTCYIRCVLYYFFAIGRYDEVIEALGNFPITNGVTVGDPDEVKVQQAIESVLKERYYVRVRDAGFIGEGQTPARDGEKGQRVDLLRTGAHFSLMCE